MGLSAANTPASTTRRALLSNEPRAATVTAETACSVFALGRADFNEVLGDCQQLMERNLNLRVCKALPLFKNLEDSELEAVADLMEERTFKKGKKIITQGQVGQTFYIIKR